MLVETYTVDKYMIEINEHPIYFDYEYVIKDFDGKIIATNRKFYKTIEDAKLSIEEDISLKNNN